MAAVASLSTVGAGGKTHNMAMINKKAPDILAEWERSTIFWIMEDSLLLVLIFNTFCSLLFMRKFHITSGGKKLFLLYTFIIAQAQ